MNQDIIENAKNKKAQAERRLAESRRIIEEQGRLAAEAGKEIDHWDFFFSQIGELTSGSPATKPKLPAPSPGKVKVKKGTLPAYVATELLLAPNHQMKASDVADKLKANGLIESENFRNIVYTTFTRRADLFEKSGPGIFRLRTADYEVVEAESEE